MVLFITFTTIVHSLLYSYDEYILNKKRDLSQNEINHGMIDGFLYIATVSFTIFAPFTALFSKIYIAFAALSCISIILNEYFFPALKRTERLVHAALYVLHPLILYAFYVSWSQNFFKTNPTYWMLQLCYLVLCFKAVTYHVIYWNYIHQKKGAPKVR